jgi:16S rRNA processing protein RimM
MMSPPKTPSIPEFLRDRAGPAPTVLCVPVARIGRAHGLDGSFAVRSLTPGNEPESLNSIERVWLRPPGAESAAPDSPWFETRVITRRSGTPLRLRLHGIDDRQQARALVHWELWVARDDFPQPDEGEFYVIDLIGAEVFDAQGQSIGTVIQVWQGPAHDNLVVMDLEGDELQIPLVEAHVDEIDLEAKRVTLTGRPIRAST